MAATAEDGPQLDHRVPEGSPLQGLLFCRERFLHQIGANALARETRSNEWNALFLDALVLISMVLTHRAMVDLGISIPNGNDPLPKETFSVAVLNDAIACGMAAVCGPPLPMEHVSPLLARATFSKSGRKDDAVAIAQQARRFVAHTEALNPKADEIIKDIMSMAAIYVMGHSSRPENDKIPELIGAGVRASFQKKLSQLCEIRAHDTMTL